MSPVSDCACAAASKRIKKPVLSRGCHLYIVSRIQSTCAKFGFNLEAPCTKKPQLSLPLTFTNKLKNITLPKNMERT